MKGRSTLTIDYRSYYLCRLFLGVYVYICVYIYICIYLFIDLFICLFVHIPIYLHRCAYLHIEICWKSKICVFVPGRTACKRHRSPNSSRRSQEKPKRSGSVGPSSRPQRVWLNQEEPPNHMSCGQNSFGEDVIGLT